MMRGPLSEIRWLRQGSESLRIAGTTVLSSRDQFDSDPKSVSDNRQHGNRALPLPMPRVPPKYQTTLSVVLSDHSSTEIQSSVST